MKPTATEVQQLYIAYFNRPAEPDGLRYWTGVDASQDTIAATFALATEFKQRYANMSNMDIVQAMYHNLFGRAADAGGAEYWSGLLDIGAVKPDFVALSLMRGARGSDAVVLANKVQMAQSLTESIPTLLPYVADRDLNAITSMWLEQVTDTASLQIARTALAEQVAHPGTSTMMVSGQAQGVGFLRDATVFIDTNGNGVLDTNEQSTKTDANGHFLLASTQSSDFPQPGATWNKHVLVTGGFDLATQRAHNGTLSLTFEQQHSGGYPATTLVRANASAMTTLRDALLRQGATADAADATLATAFGSKFSAGADNLVAVLDAESIARAEALTVFAFNAEIDGIAEVVARTLQLLSARWPASGVTYLPPKLSLDVAMKAAYEGMASVLTELKGSASLDNGATLLKVLTTAATLPRLADGTVLDGTAAKSLAALSTATLDAFKQIMGTAVPLAQPFNDHAVTVPTDPWPTLVRTVQVRAMLDDLADTLPQAVAQNKAAALLPQWTATAIAERVAAKDVGDIDPYSQSDSYSISLANGTPPALDKLAVEQVYVAMLNRPASPAELQKWMTKGDAAALATELKATPEWQGKSSDAEAVNTLYVNLFGHAADVSGLTYWTGVLRDQKVDLGTLAQYLAKGAGGSDITTVRNKTVGALEFTSALSTPELVANFNTNPLAAKYWMTNVTDDATLKTSLDQLTEFVISDGGPVVVIGAQDNTTVLHGAFSGM
ncbi:DUF4214 domain-containing protein [Duganella sp. FT92W]|uniref:DUF4214 domain-containing protein n=1 Tax=Pseudoduganella rivuli TaxID=2666085 RepID=A0A7X2LWU2_9BURK|nr:DUF4214 domain-containing protein [Pseudoduganella rivuli]MRV75512.1 DUF4214 domain-containing protein [Pseudoduganella rivuli]